MLRRESDQHHFALAQFRRDDGRFAGQVLFAHQPAALQQVAIRVARDGLAVLDILGGDFERRPGRDIQPMRGHSECNRAGVVVRHPQGGSGAAELLRALPVQDVANANPETIHGKGRGGVQGHQGAALLDKVADGIVALGAEAGAVLGRGVAAPSTAASSPPAGCRLGSAGRSDSTASSPPATLRPENAIVLDDLVPSGLSAPSWKPKNVSGVVISGDRPARRTREENNNSGIRAKLLSTTPDVATPHGRCIAVFHYHW